VAAYCTRLNKLVSAVLVNAGPITEAANNSDKLESTGEMVRPRMKRR
jgi:hypothetical protein